MLARTAGIVERIESERPGLQELRVRTDSGVRRAINYTGLNRRLEAGDRVVLNTWAVELGLGTGGADFVVEEGRAALEEPAGHVLKLRYTPLQFPVLAAEAPESPHHRALRNFRTLSGTPVVCAELHSQVPAVAAAVKWECPRARVAYVMTDGAALPMAYSRLVPRMKECGLLDATVTAGQAFGGDFEAVNLYSGLAVARQAAGADAIIVCQGPGNTGTQTELGFSGLDQGIALNAAASLDGTPIAVVRMSLADPRARHRGISHHTLTVLDRVALAPAFVPIPRLTGEAFRLLRATLDRRGLLERHEFITVDAEQGFQALARAGIQVTTMGRPLEQEREFFLSAAAAGLVAGQWVAGTLMEHVERITDHDRQHDCGH